MSRAHTPPTAPPPALVVRRTDGDFPQARRPSLTVACCTCTTCCVTLVGGGLGVLIGAVHGGLKGWRNDAYLRSPQVGTLVRILAVCAFGFLHAVFGLLIGAGIGFVIDYLVFTYNP